MSPRKKLDEQLRTTTSHTPPLDPLKEIKKDFRNFLWVVWRHLGLPPPTDVQYDIADWLQHGPRRQIMEAFRGVGKSWITVAFVCWLLLNNPNEKILVTSANESKANEFSTFTLQLIRSLPFLVHLAPRADQRQSLESFDVNGAQPDQAPSVKSVGITGQVTGSRATRIVADDIEIPKNSDTHTKREKLLENIKEFDAVIKPGGRIYYLGTPQTEQTIYNTLISRGYVMRIWPSRYPSDINKYGMNIAPWIREAVEKNPKIVGTPTDPKRFSDEDLRERELSYGRSGYALQFQLDTSLSDAEKYPLKLSDLIVFPLDTFRAPIDFMWASSAEHIVCQQFTVGLQGDRYHQPAWYSPDVAAYENTLMFVDPSGRGKDETAYVVLKLLHGRIFLVAAGGFLGDGYSPEVLKKLLSVAKKYNAPQILSEPNFGGGMFSKLLQSTAQSEGFSIGAEDAEWSTTQKEARIIDTLEPVMNQHRLIVCPSVIESDYNSTLKYDGDNAPHYRLFYQLTRMVKEKGALPYDDRLDCLAMGVGYYTEQLARDTHRAVLDHKEALLNKELERFMKHALGGTNVQDRRMASRLGRLGQKQH